MTIAMAWKASDPSHHLNGDIKVHVDLKHLHELNNDNGTLMIALSMIRISVNDDTLHAPLETIAMGQEAGGTTCSCYLFPLKQGQIAFHY